LPRTRNSVRRRVPQRRYTPAGMQGLMVSATALGLIFRAAHGAAYHPGNPALHITRLHRYDHSGLAAMLEAEAKWSRLAGGTAPDPAPAGARKRFVQLSDRQAEALAEHHQSMLVQVGAALHGRGTQTGSARAATNGVTLHEVRRYYRENKLAATGDVTAVRLSSLDSQYVGPIGVGTTVSPPGCTMQGAASFLQPGRARGSSARLRSGRACEVGVQSQVWVVFDTGSTNIWVSSDLCKSGACTKPGRRRYDHTLSKTYQPPQHDVLLNIEFGTGKISGPQAIDDFHVGPFTTENQTFGMIQVEDGKVFEDVPFEGILGLAFPSMSANGVTPFFDNVIHQKALPKNEFAFYFSLDTPAANAVFWGGVDKAFHSGPIEYFGVTDPYYWSIPMLSFRIGDDELLAPTRKGEGGSLLEAEGGAGAWKGPRAIIDTGTTFFTAEDPLFNEVMRRLPTTSCDSVTAASHPPLTYRLRNSAGEPRDFVLNNSQYMTHSNYGSMCSPAFMKINIPKRHGPAMVLGEVFLRHYFSVFDRGDGDSKKARIGFALASHGDAVTRHLKAITQNQPSFNPGS